MPTDFLFVYLNSLLGVIRHIVLSAIIGFTVYKNFISVDWWKVQWVSMSEYWDEEQTTVCYADERRESGTERLLSIFHSIYHISSYF